MSKFGELVLVLGDAQIPYRAADFPDMFKKMFIPGKFKQVILTGNMCTENEVKFFKDICPNVIKVKGSSDEDDLSPSIIKSTVAGYKISVYASDMFIAGPTKEALGAVAKKSECDILIYGQTHDPCIESINDVVCINPGSVTGAYTPLKDNVVPSFFCLSLLPDTINVFSYFLIDGKLSVKKDSFPHKE